MVTPYLVTGRGVAVLSVLAVTLAVVVATVGAAWLCLGAGTSGRHLVFMVCLCDRPLACVGFLSAELSGLGAGGGGADLVPV